MAGVNKVIIVGRLGQDPEMRYTPGGQAMARFSVATSESWTDKQGQKQERTEWHRIIVWGKLAEICGQHLAKGRQVYVEGRLQTRSWDDKTSGQKRYTTEINANTVQFLGGASAGTSPSQGASAGSGYGMTGGNAGPYGTASAGSAFDGPSEPAYMPEPAFDSDEEIPF